MLGNYISANFNRTNNLKRPRPKVLSLEKASQVKRLNKREEEFSQSLVDYNQENLLTKRKLNQSYRWAFYFGLLLWVLITYMV